jgi:ComF family protein
MRPIAGGTCSSCGERLHTPYAFLAEAEARCGLCRRLEPPFVKAVAYGSYEGGLRELIHILKYGQVRPAANVLGRMLAEVIAGLEPAFGLNTVMVVPVPLHARRLRQRGVNHSELIARAALKLRPTGDRLVLNPKILERRRDTQSQTGLTRRRENIRGGFVVGKSEELSRREVLVVDDVFTTGTTVSECARVLMRAGASKVWIATVARTLKADAQHADTELDEIGMTMAAHG